MKISKNLLPFAKTTAAALMIAAAASAAAACNATHTVQDGESLASIALQQQGNVFAYETIYAANQSQIGPDPSAMTAGMELRIPCTPAADNALDWSTLPAVETVARLMMSTDIQVLDIRGPAEIVTGVLPGAVSVPFANWRGPKDNPTAPPSDATLVALIGAAGLDLNAPIVVVGQSAQGMHVGEAAKVYWLLKSAGAAQIAIMRDGFAGWDAAGLPVADGPVVANPDFAAVTLSANWRADVIALYGVATRQLPGYLLNSGTDGACTLDDASASLIASAAFDMRDQLAANQVGADGHIISACDTAELAALSWFLASELAGIDNALLYPEAVEISTITRVGG